jgi:hypothetical protein
MHKNIFITIAIITGFALSFNAQVVHKRDTIETTIQIIPAPPNGYVQVSLFHPIGTSWTKSKYKTYNFSLNIIHGQTGGINGFEFGPFSNVTRGDVRGVQIGGVNVVKGKAVNGIQFGLLANVTLANTKGLQLSGGWTHNHGEFYGFQFSWLGNTNWNSVYGAQLSHLWNHSQKNLYGLQFALGPNTVKENAYGIQFSASMNYAGKEHKGAQFAFFANYAGSSEGFQLGMVNISKQYAGIQGGLFNYAGKSNQLQAGLINIAPKGAKLQVGLINYSGDSLVAPVGLINVVKNGYNKLEVWGSELQSFNLAIKTGGHKFYSILSAGTNPFNENKYWTMGWGVGSHIQITKRFYSDIDNITSIVNINEPISFGTGKNTFLNQTRFTAGFAFHKKVALYIGPMINFLISDNNQLVDGKNGIVLAPTFRTAYGSIGNYQFALWPGITGGIRFF